MKILQRTRFGLLAVAFVAVLIPTPARALFPVFDAANAAMFIEELISQAAEIANQVQQIQNQVQSLQNQAEMLANLEVSNYEDALDAMQCIQNVLRRHCVEIGVVPNRIGFDSGFDCAALMEQFRQACPPPADWAGQSDAQIARYPDQWNAQRRAAAFKAMQTQDASVEAMTGTAQRMGRLAEASQNAPGQKAAVQVTNQMLVSLSSQMRSQQAATLAHQRSIAMEQARKAAWRQRNEELIGRITRDAHTEYPVTPVADPFGR